MVGLDWMSVAFCNSRSSADYILEPLIASYSACGMSGLLRSNPQTVVQGSKASFRSSHQALGIADWGLSTPQREQDGLKW